MDVTKCASAQSILNLGKAFDNFFEDLKKPKGARRRGYPKLKKKGQNDRFALWNDQTEIRNLTDRFGKDRGEVWIPSLGYVRMREALRHDGKLLGAVISRDAAGWSISFQVERPDVEVTHGAPGTVSGIDLNLSKMMRLSRPLPDGTREIKNQKPLKRVVKRIKRLSRAISRQEDVRKKSKSKKTSKRAIKRRSKLSKTHWRAANIRLDAIHKATDMVTKHFETLVIEDLNVAGMVKNHNLAGSLFDVSFGEIRRQIEYKADRRGGHVLIADRFFPSSKKCSICDAINADLKLKHRTWTCATCGTTHDRDENASFNLERLHTQVGPAWPKPSQSESSVAKLGEIAALADSQESVKLRSMNRELNRCEEV